jgi:hypothetical protein
MGAAFHVDLPEKESHWKNIRIKLVINETAATSLALNANRP